jgi:hypothetical protein
MKGMFSILGKCGINYKHFMVEFTASEKFIIVHILLERIPASKHRRFWHLANEVSSSCAV